MVRRVAISYRPKVVVRHEKFRENLDDFPVV